MASRRHCRQGNGWWNARNAARPGPRRSAASGRLRARRNGAAATVSSLSTCSSATDEGDTLSFPGEGRGPAAPPEGLGLGLRRGARGAPMSVSFHRLVVAEVVDETAEARSIRFAVPEELHEAF